MAKMDPRTMASRPRSVSIAVTPSDTVVPVGNSKIAMCVPADLNGLRLTGVTGAVFAAGTGSGATTVQIRRVRAGTAVSMLATPVSLGPNAYADSAMAVDSNYALLQTGDLLFVDVTAVHAVPPQGLFVALTFSP